MGEGVAIEEPTEKEVATAFEKDKQDNIKDIQTTRPTNAENTRPEENRLNHFPRDNRRNRNGHRHGNENRQRRSRTRRQSIPLNQRHDRNHILLVIQDVLIIPPIGQIEIGEIDPGGII